MTPAASFRRWVPRLWRGEAGIVGRLLGPVLLSAELVFSMAVRTRNSLYDVEVLPHATATLPVISVGNLTVGGTGKTPITAWIASLLRRWGRRPGIVLRGYGADEIEVHRELNPAIPVFAAAERIQGATAAADAGCDCVLLDDGFQHRKLRRDLDIVLLAAEQWNVPRRLLPRGGWREPPSSLHRAGYVLITRKSASTEEARGIAAELSGRFPRLRVGIAHLAPTEVVPLMKDALVRRPLEALRGSRVLAVSSLADPRPFVDQLEEAGVDVELLAYPDHHEFTREEVERIRARAAGRQLVVTRKEAVKLRRLAAPPDVQVLEQEVRMERGEAELEEILRRVLGEGE